MAWQIAVEGHEAQGCWVIPKQLSSSLGAVKHPPPAKIKVRST